MKVNAQQGEILQMAYTVPNIQAAALHYAKTLNIGPWFIRGPMHAANSSYRGLPTDLILSIAISYSGSLMVELIEQHNDVPSVYMDVIKKRGHGFHHWGIATKRMDEDIELYKKRGYELVYTNVTPSGSRIAYFDSTTDLPGMIELIEITEPALARYTKMHDATVNWDGTNPIIRT